MIASFSQLNKPSVLGPAFRKSESKKPARTPSLRGSGKGELRPAGCELQPFDPKGLRFPLGNSGRCLCSIQREFEPGLVRSCAAHGVAVVFVPHLPKSYVVGAAYWIGDKAVIQLSLRFRTNDHFWFSFFHELGHILLHGKKETFLDDFKASTDQKEKDANLFACKALIPDAEFERLKTLRYSNRDVIKRFSGEIGIAPGIVVGRLQHEDLLPYQKLPESPEGKTGLEARSGAARLRSPSWIRVLSWVRLSVG